MKVSRRTAIGAAMAALFAPTIRLREEIDHERLLRGFCDDDPIQVMYDHSKPYQVGGLSYATDARHMCWAELCKPQEDGGERRIPCVEDVRKHLFIPGRWQDFELPPLESLKIAKDGSGLCPACGNRRKSLGDAYPSQEWLNEYGYKLGWDCDDNTINDTSCEMCHGEPGKVPSIAIVCGVALSHWRLKPIAALPNVRVAAIREPVVGFKNRGPFLRHELICFEADGFQGVAMGISPECVQP